jgi:hypothetical protein
MASVCEVTKYLGIHTGSLSEKFAANERCGRAHAHRLIFMQAERCGTGQTAFSRPSLHVGAGSCRAAVAWFRAARKKVRWSAVKAPDDGRLETGPTRRPSVVMI